MVVVMARNEAYRKAEQKIEEARRSGAKELDLRGGYYNKAPKLTELPESLGQLTQLQSLNLGSNQLTALPDWLGQLTQLQLLNLSGNQLTTLPASLGQLTRLLSLDLSRNQLTALPEWLGQLMQLQSLNLSGNQLTALPEWLGQLTQLQSLNLSGNQLTTLPASLGQLTRLLSLDLSRDQLTALPEWLGRFTQVQSLDLGGNQLTALPDWLGQLTQLQSLDLSHSRLTTLPEWLGRFSNLKSLEIRGCSLVTIPEFIRKLTELETLQLTHNKLSMIPGWIGELVALQRLGLNNNPLKSLSDSLGALKRLEWLWVHETQLHALPESLGQATALLSINASSCQLNSLPSSLAGLDNLSSLWLDDNPLNPELAAAYKQGIDAVKRYLREMAKGARKRYEAKLLILGDGNEGKTCVSRALRGLPFRTQKTTHGVDVEQWKFAHPDDTADREKDITLNIWDFEGQEISHQTHQFFLTSQSLYLLVFKCRDQFLLDRAEYWLDTIRARAPKAKVAIVISQCEGRSPLVPLDRIEAQYGDLLAKEWFFPVGCKDGSNIPKLKTFLQRWAAGLEFMGSPWPVSYNKAETEIKVKARRGMAQITRVKLHAAFAKAGVSKDGREDAAAAMSRLGVITQFPDCPDLRDFIVLRPQWLTKAISKVMEDGKLSADKGEMTLQRMEAMWKKDYAGMFPTFHDCMKEFELCYDLEDDARSCLVPLRFGYLRPAIPWSNSPGMKERRVEYKLNVRPPMGIMSRFIVKTHHMIVKTPGQPKGVYWHNGVFLRSGEGPLCSEALCEFVPEERKLRIEVRAAYPQNMCEQIHAYVKAVFSFFSGLEAERSYGCIKVDSTTGAEERCSGLHTEKRIYTAISKRRPTFDCEFEEHEVDPRMLVWGFSSFSEFVMAKVVSVTQLRQELDKEPEWAAPFLRGVGALLDWVNVNGGKMDQLLQAQSALTAEFKQEAELKLHEYLALTSQMLDDRDYTAAPGLISISTKDRSKWNPAGYFKKTYVLTPYCECKGNIHPCEDGHVEFTKDRDWWEKTAPWIARGTKLLSAGLQLAFAGMPLALGNEVFDVIKDDVKFMDELTKHMELKEGDKEDLSGAEKVVQGDVGKDLRGGDRESRLTRAALARLLEETAPINYRARQWGSLRRVKMSDDSYRWLCEDCAKRSH
jgi:Leucine-rich repeat (LRR) protein